MTSSGVTAPRRLELQCTDRQTKLGVLVAELPHVSSLVARHPQASQALTFQHSKLKLCHFRLRLSRKGAAMAPRPEFNTEQVRSKSRKDLLHLLESVSSICGIRHLLTVLELFR